MSAPRRAPAAPPGVVDQGRGTRTGRRALALFGYFVLGLIFGVTLIQSEAASWYRIQEMFRFQGFQIYGIFLTALAVGIPATALVKRLGLRSLEGEHVRPPAKELGRGYRYVLGSGTFGVGLAMTGACPGPVYALLGYGVWPMAVVLVSAVAGAWIYGVLRPHLPHY